MAISAEAIWLRTTCSQNGLELRDEQLVALETLAVRLLEWNQKINLISRRDEENLWSTHLLHSLAVLFKVSIPVGYAVLDLGTGGGLPGLPIKIARPDLSITLLDSTRKKINVVTNLIEILGLKETKAVWGRAEEIGKGVEHNCRYDIVVARGVSSMRDLVRWSEPFLRLERTVEAPNSGPEDGLKRRIEGPSLLALKGGELERELRQIRSLPQVRNILTLDLTLKGSRQLEVGEKKIVVVEIARTRKESQSQ